jgi:ribonuclease HII
MTVGAVLAHLASGAPTETFLEECRHDPRAGVRRALEARDRRDAARRREEARLARLYAAHERLEARGLLVGGIDEAGRGPLAGPVVAACVILPPAPRLEGLDDSKKVTAEKREALEAVIRQTALGVGVGLVEPDEIDRINILEATKVAFRKAAAACVPRRPDHLLNDALTVPGLAIPQQGIVHGDARVACIAAASIVAKVTRDRIMVVLDARYPGYGFARHKGYGTADHMAALARLGPCPIHRRSFLKLEERDPVRLFTSLRRALLEAGTRERLEEVGHGVRDVKATLGRARIEILRRLYARRRAQLAAGP